MKALLLTATLLSPTALSQAPSVGEIMGIVRTESGRPVEGAALRFCGDLLPALEEDAFGAEGSRRTAESATGRGGRFRFDVPRTAGSLWVTTADGLGAVVPLVRTSDPLVVTVTPLAAVRLADDRDFGCLIQTLRPGRDPSRLQDEPSAPSPVLRLPAGRYLLFVGTPEGWTERTVELTPGTQSTIDPTRPAGRAVPAPPRSWEPTRWPGLLLPFGDAVPVHLAGPDLLTRRVREGDDVILFVRNWFDPERPPTEGSPRGGVRSVEIRSANGEASGSVGASTWATTPGGLVRVAASTRRPGESSTRCWIPDPAGSARVLFRAPGHRPMSLPADRLPDVVTLEPSPPCELRVRVPGLRPATVRVQEPGDPCSTFAVMTDARGIAVLPHTPTNHAEISVTAPGCTPAQGTFESLGLPGETLTLEIGQVLRGRVIDEQGRPVAFCEVEVRDPSTQLLGVPRRTVSDESGRFEVGGLADGTYTIWVQGVRDGRTFSGQTRGAQPGRDTWDVTLRDEDPKRPGRG